MFFSPLRALVGLAVVVVGFGFAWHVYRRVTEEQTFSIGGALLAGALVLGGAGGFATAFPHGCRACRRAFDVRYLSFGGEHYDAVVTAMGQGAEGIARLAGAPMPTSSERLTRVRVESCAQCHRVGVARVCDDEWQGQYYKTHRQAPARVLAPDEIVALNQVATARGMSEL
jgi:hypothetical protein